MNGGKKAQRHREKKNRFELFSQFHLRKLVENKVFILGGRQESSIGFADEILVGVEVDVAFTENITLLTLLD